jgi:hypothetical protein
MQEITNECKVGGIELCDLHAKLHQIFETFDLFELMNHYTHEWSFTMWMMPRAIQLIE